MRSLIYAFVFLSISFSYSQEKETKKRVETSEIKELNKELKKKVDNTKELNQLRKKHKEFIDSPKKNIKKTQERFNFERALETLKLLQDQPSIFDAVNESGNSDAELPESENDDNQRKGKIADDRLEPPKNLRSDRTRLRGPSQFDSRIEIRELSDDIDWQWYILQRNKSIGLVVDKRELKLLSNGIYQLNTSNTLVTKFNICKNEPFTKQSVVGIGTSFIVDTNKMITAQHVFTKSIDNYVIVFGYELFNQAGLVEAIVTESNLYYPKKITKSLKELDITIFEVDREFEDRESLKWKESKDLKKGREVYLIGHPSGLPKKVALNASILDNSYQQYFYTSLDSFQGNSGSPVFDFVSHKVIGVLVSGEIDYNFNGSCYESNLCKVPYCKGEKVIRIENILNN